MNNKKDPTLRRMIKVLGLYWDVLVLPKDFNSVAVEDV
jgi:hypothetical protein